MMWKLNDVKVYSALLILVACYYIYYFVFNDYLPAPFFFNRNDVFMDFYNVLHWAHDDQRYSEWKSIYPPFSFLLTDVISKLLPSYDTSYVFEVRNFTIYFFISISVVFLLFSLLIDLNRLPKEHKNLTIFIYLSAPMLFAFERGNIIIFCYLFLIFAYKNQKNDVLFSFFLALAISLKIYLVALLFVLIFINDYRKIFLTIIFFIFINLISGFFINSSDWYLIYQNITVFSSASYYYEWAYFTFSFKGMVQLIQFYFGFSSGFFGSNFSSILGLLSFVAQLTSLIIFALAVVMFSYLPLNKRDELIDYLTLLLLMLILIVVVNAGGYAFILLFPFILILTETAWARFFLFLSIVPTGFVLVSTDTFFESISALSGEYIYFNRDIYLGMILRPLSFLLLYLVVFINFYNKLRKIESTPNGINQTLSTTNA